jgi:YidC/Oxa1 family membrane protein insertase
MNNLDSKALLGIALCVLFYFGYSQYLGKKYPDYGKPPAEATSETGQEPNAREPGATPPGATPPGATPSGATSATAPSANAAITGAAAADTAPAAVAKLSAEELTITTDTNVYRFSQDLGALTSVVLKDYKSGKERDSPPVELLDQPLVFAAEIRDGSTADGAAARPGTPAPPWNAERRDRTLRFWTTQGDWEIAQEHKIPDKGFGGTVDLVFTNKSAKPLELTSGLVLRTAVIFKTGKKILGVLPGAPGDLETVVSGINGKTAHADLKGKCDDATEPAVDAANEAVEFFGVDSHYFLKVLEPASKTTSLTVRKARGAGDSCALTFVNGQTNGEVQPGESVRMSYATYFGPKDLNIMHAYDDKLAGTIKLGFFDFIAKPLLAVIHGFRKIFGNYGVSIIVLTILLKVLFFPLMKASATSMHKMKKLNPQMAEIREKFKDDKQRQQQELMKFMGANGVNPMKGCLPILPQIPVFFAFYQVLQSAIELRHAPFYGWIQDLSAMDPYFVTPILMGVAMLVQQKLTPTTGMDKTQEKIMMFMPIMFTAMMLTLPAGMTLYMLTNTVFGIAQQKWLYRRLDKVQA